MLPRSFAPLASAEPQFHGVFEVLDMWLKRHKDWKWLVPGIVAQDFPALDAFDLAAALNSAVIHGFLRVEYTVLTPSGVLADQSFVSPRAIPRQIPDRQEHFFETDSLPIVPVYMLPESAAQLWSSGSADREP
jgi:hypothetical protein